MSHGEIFYLAVVIATFGGFGLWVGYNSNRYTRRRAGKPEAIRYTTTTKAGAAAD